MGKSYQPPIYVQQGLVQMIPHLDKARQELWNVAGLPWLDKEAHREMMALIIRITADIDLLRSFTADLESRTK